MIHLQGAFSDLGNKPGDFPVAEQVSAQCLSLSIYPYISKKDQELIAAAISKLSAEM